MRQCCRTRAQPSRHQRLRTLSPRSASSQPRETKANRPQASGLPIHVGSCPPAGTQLMRTGSPFRTNTRTSPVRSPTLAGKLTTVPRVPSSSSGASRLTSIPSGGGGKAM
ncbi:hypothetical protein Mterra_04072 [Calidithermus terrae]|uniref:Uncharacterized protein n=1 Tax=Calidithermus terrae TaxID=1408545 RepID=A0A399DRY4_9DEIN|nr:hypothetical protein Mterra_04072 [Calidithermus terrae]